MEILVLFTICIGWQEDHLIQAFYRCNVFHAQGFIPDKSIYDLNSWRLDTWFYSVKIVMKKVTKKLRASSDV